MKQFDIVSWAYTADKPLETQVKVAVTAEVAPGIGKTENYEFTLKQRFETMSDEFKAAVHDVLLSAQLL